MEAADHSRTFNYGRSALSINTQAGQAFYVASGQYDKAFNLGIDNVKLLFPNGKYSKGIAEVKAYAKKFLEEYGGGDPTGIA